MRGIDRNVERNGKSRGKGKGKGKGKQPERSGARRNKIRTGGGRFYRTYLMTCATGLQGIIEKRLSNNQISGYEVEHIEDGIITFKATASLSDLKSANFGNMLFEVVGAPMRADSCDTAIFTILSNPGRFDGIRQIVSDRARTFRLSISEEGRLVNGGSASRRLVSRISKTSGLRPGSLNPDAELWVLRRRSGYCVFAKRLPMKRASEKQLAQGQLRP